MAGFRPRRLFATFKLRLWFQDDTLRVVWISQGRGFGSALFFRFRSGGACPRETACDLLAEFANGHETDYALYWTGDEDAEIVRL